MQLFCSFRRFRAAFCALSGQLRAPKGAGSCTKLPKAAESCTLHPSAASGCLKRLGLLGGAHEAPPGGGVARGCRLSLIHI
eukprot:15019913-Alexandrium_andersonii.AAC.1